MTMKIFDLYTAEDIKIEDPALRHYINLDSKLVIKSRGRAREKFGKARVNIIERLINHLAVPGHRGKKHKIITKWASGKYSQKVKVLLETFKIIEQETKTNPLQVLVKAIENSAPRDEITVIEYGGARYPQAVDVSPTRRINIALRHLANGAYDKSFNKKTSIAQALAKEIIAAYNNNNESLAITKRNESEKQADAAR
ncbi:30S ribosomal protein S7 [Candidatus Pacearchaeota archaeon]|nr:30S ribosomal protein S7 [Candidatus Pacearchaeota archaeon]